MLAKRIQELGGLLFFAHTEEKRHWELPELTGMEIYNIHADFKRFKGGLRSLLPQVIVNHRRFPDHVFRLIFQRPIEAVARWDDLNRSRHITGVAGNDCHQNTGFRGFYTTNGTLRVEDTSPRTLKEWKLNWLTRGLARWWFGPLEPGRKLFHVQLDPYERMARFVNTHVLARDLTEPEILEALRAMCALYRATQAWEELSGMLRAVEKRFGAVTVLNGHIHQTMQKVEGNITFHTAASTAFPQPKPGEAPSPGPMKVPAEQLRNLLGITDVNTIHGRHSLAVIDSNLT